MWPLSKNESPISEIAEQEFRPQWVFSYLLFAVYSLSLSPLITRFITLGQKSYFVVLSGLFIYVAEFFAFQYKLKVIRLRSEAKRAEHQKATGEYLPEPHINPFLWFAVGMRMIFRFGFVMVIINALGADAPSLIRNGYGFIILITMFFEIFLLGYLYSQSTLLQNPPVNLKEVKQERFEDEAWRKENLDKPESVQDERKEMLSDIVLQIYSFMLFTAVWEYINQLGISQIHQALRSGEKAFEAGLDLFTMLGAMAGVGLLPMRLAYWIEESVEAISKQEKQKMMGYFILAALLTCAPSIREYIDVYF